MTETQMKKAKYPRDCKRCLGYGFYDHKGAELPDVPISRAGAITGFKTKACLVCGGNVNPNGK